MYYVTSDIETLFLRKKYSRVASPFSNEVKGSRYQRLHSTLIKARLEIHIIIRPLFLTHLRHMLLIILRCVLLIHLSYLPSLIGLKLNHSGIIAFLNKEGFSSADTEALAAHLGISRPKIKTLKVHNVGNARGFLNQVIGTWLDLVEPTEELLADALDRSGYAKIARKLRGE